MFYVTYKGLEEGRQLYKLLLDLYPHSSDVDIDDDEIIRLKYLRVGYSEPYQSRWLFVTSNHAKHEPVYDFHQFMFFKDSIDIEHHLHHLIPNAYGKE